MDPSNPYLDLSLQQIPYAYENPFNAYYGQEDVLARSKLDSSPMWAEKQVHVQNSNNRTYPFLERSLKEAHQSSAANEFQFDPPTACPPGAAPDKSMFKDPVNLTHLSQHVKKMLDSGWKFNPVQCSAPAALARPNSAGSLTKDEFHWIKGITSSRASKETSITQAEEALAKGYVTKEMNRESVDDDEPLDDASLKKLLDNFYDGIKYGPSGQCTGMAIDDGYDDSDVAKSHHWFNLSPNPLSMEHSFGTDMRIHESFTNSGINFEGASSDELTKKLPSAPTFPIAKASESDRLYMQNIYSDSYSNSYLNLNGIEQCNQDSPIDLEALAALEPKEPYKKNEHAATLGIMNTYDKKLHDAVEHETNIMREIIEANLDDYDPAEYWMPNMSIQTSTRRCYPPLRKGQTSTDSPDRSAAVGNQLLTDLQASANPSAPRSLPQPKKSGSSSDLVVSSSPVKFNPDLPHGEKALPTTTGVNLLPEYDSDGEEYSYDTRQVTPTPSNRGASRLGHHIPNTPAHLQNAQSTNLRRTGLAFPPPIMFPSTSVHMNATSSNELRDGSAAFSTIYPGQPTSSQILSQQSTADIITPTRPYFPTWTSTPGSSSPSPPKRFALPQSIFRGKILTTPTKQKLQPTAPCPWLVRTNAGPHPPVASMYPGQHQRMAPTNTRREFTGKKVASKGKNNAGKQKRAATGGQSAEAGPTPKKRRTTKWSVDDVRRRYERID